MVALITRCLVLLLVAVAAVVERCTCYRMTWGPVYNSFDHKYDDLQPQDIMVDYINRMGLYLLNAHNENNLHNNIALSPYGAVSVLIALAEGLRGDAALEIYRASNIPHDLTIVRIGLRDIHRHLKTYFIPREGFLAGLTLSHDNVTLTASYERILRFYGYDVESFRGVKVPGLPSSVPAATPRPEPEDRTEPRIAEATTPTTAVTSRATEESVTIPVVEVTTAPPPVVSPETTTTMLETTARAVLTEQTAIAATTTAVPETTARVITAEQTTAEATTTTTTTTTAPETTARVIVTEQTSAATTTTKKETTTTTTAAVTTTEPEVTTTSAVATTSKVTALTTEEAPEETTTSPPETSTEEHTTTTTTDTPESEHTTAITETTELQTENGATATEVQVVTTESEAELLTTTTEAAESATGGLQALRVSSANLTSRMSNITGRIEMITAINIQAKIPDDEANTKRNQRSIIDYLIARYYDDYYIPKKHHFPKFHRRIPFFIDGVHSIYRAHFMTYDTVLPFFYMPDLDALALSFPLDSSHYYLLLILPVREDGIDDLVCDLKRNPDLKYIIKNMKYTHVRAVIPSFMLKGHVNLTPSLQRLGIQKIFEPHLADFTPMTNNKDVYVTNIEQAITVTIRNYVDLGINLDHGDLYRYGPVEFKADHPFLYFVMDAQMHVALMAGKIVDPLITRIR